jgi:hypothetical protein
MPTTVGQNASRTRAVLSVRWAVRDPSVNLVVLDLSSVQTHLLVQPLSWLAAEADGALWWPMLSGPGFLDHDRAIAKRCAELVELPLVWPERHPAPVPRAMRITALACERGRGATAMFSFARLAFGAGADLDRIEQGAGLEEFEAEESGDELFLEGVEQDTGLTPVETKLAAEQGSDSDAALSLLAVELRAVGISSAPALRWRGQTYLGCRAICSVLLKAPRAPLQLQGMRLDEILSTVGLDGCPAVPSAASL